MMWCLRTIPFALLVALGGARGLLATEVQVFDPEQRPVVSYGSSHALLIGISNYDDWDDKKLEWTDLPSIPRELAEIEAVLVEHDFKVETFLDLDKKALRETIDEFFERYGLDVDNRLLVYFAGHGYTRHRYGGRYAYIVPRDAPNPGRVDPRPFLEKAIALEELETQAAIVEARHVLFLFDSCFAGTLFETRGEIPPQPAFISSTTARPVRHFFTAGGAGETVPAKSLFAPALVRGLRGAADLVRDGYITGTELFSYLQAEASAKGLTPQEEKLPSFREGEFVFALPIEAPPAQLQVGEFIQAYARNEPWVHHATVREQILAHLKDFDWNGDWGINSADGDDGPQPGDLWVDPAIGMRFRYISPGTFMMGSPPDEPGRFDWETQHRVTLTHGYWLGETEVTQAQWQQVLKTTPSTFESCGATCPVETVNWYEAVIYANALSESADLSPCYEVTRRVQGKEGKIQYDSVKRREPCSGYRLPTEAEWERAARSGTSTAIYSGRMMIQEAMYAPELDAIAWYGGNSRGPQPVGGKQPNAWGLHDLLGNEYEWCEDRWALGDYAGSAQTDPMHTGGSYRVIRGGSWNSSARFVRAAYRNGSEPGYRGADVGFRLARGQGPEARTEQNGE